MQMHKLIEAATAAALLLTTASSVLASDTPKQPPRMTGQQLIDDFQAGAGQPLSSRGPDSPSRSLAADGYLDGVADAFHGLAWCSDGSLKPHEINATVMFRLRKLGKETLDGPAAGLVRDALSQSFPCRK